VSTLRSPSIPAQLRLAIHRAASDPACWPEAVAQLTQWTGGDVGSLAARRLGPTPETVRVTSGIDPRHRRSYVAHARTSDPYPAKLITMPVGRAMLMREILGTDSLDRKTYAYRLLQSQNLKHLQCVLAHRTPHWILSFATARGTDRDFDRRSLARLEVAARHIADALDSGPGLDVVAEAIHPPLEMAQQMGLAKFFQIDHAGRILHGHGAAEQLSLSSPNVQIERHRFRALAAKDQTRLARSAARAARGEPSLLILGRGEKALPLGLARGPRRSPISAERCVSVVFAPREPRPTLVANARLKALPDALRSVAELLSEGLTDKEIAGRLGLPITTARTYVSRVLKRLEMSSRRELMGRTLGRA
jgi:hypothetical protein